jgi:peptide/nickel transport system permease protein
MNVLGKEIGRDQSYLIRNLSRGFKVIWRDPTSRFAFLYLSALLVLAVVGQEITPYSYDRVFYASEGGILRSQPPSIAHPLGTTSSGRDVLSRLVYGVQPTVITGFVGGAIIIGIGMTVGVLAGYVGGWVESTLMRITDFAYSVPTIPFAIVLVSFLEVGFFASIIVIGLILWRGNARVLRSQVIQIKERPFILAAKATGSSRIRIIVKHILPNIAPMAALFFSLGVGYAILVNAGLAFIGVSSPFIPSWGVMIRNAYQSGTMVQAPWWSLPPGILISLTVMSAFMIGRQLEDSDDDERSVTGAGP